MSFIGDLLGVVRPGIVDGPMSTRAPRHRRIAAVARTAGRRQGNIFSTAMTPTTSAIHTRLMMPKVKSSVMSAQQQPTHLAPLLAPICRAPDLPSRQDPSRNPDGLRHFRTDTS